jgi:two-component system LytT family sensor kinase
VLTMSDGPRGLAVAPAAPARRRRWLWFLQVLGVYTFVAADFTTQSYIYLLHTERATAWWRLFVLNQGPTFYSWALVTPIIVALAARHGFGGGRWRRTLLVHLGGVVLVAPLQVAADFLMTLGAHLAFDTDPASRAALLHRAPAIVAAGALDVPQMYATIVAIVYTFDFYRKFRARELRASQLEAQLGQAQLQLLRMQLQPHFLFNTLNAIASLMHRDVAAAERMLTLLADLLRASLEAKGAQEVALKQELELLGRYLEIEQVRFSDRLHVAFDVAPEALDAAVPNLILQPLVENAIRHGIAPRSSPGEVRISARRGGNGSLVLEVADNGVGLRGGSCGPLREGVGLSNTRARLAQLYGEEARCEVTTAGGSGFVVTLTLPFRGTAETSHELAAAGAQA